MTTCKHGVYTDTRCPWCLGSLASRNPPSDAEIEAVAPYLWFEYCYGKNPAAPMPTWDEMVAGTNQNPRWSQTVAYCRERAQHALIAAASVRERGK